VTAAGWLEIAGGLVIILIVFYDLFQSVILPRPAVGRFGLVPFLFPAVWVAWRWVGTRSKRPARRESRLAAFGPVAVLMMFGAWAVSLVFGYALILDGLRDGLRPVPPNFGSSLYFSATTLVPLSYGDVLPLSIGARIATIAESATGIIVGALVITLLFSLYQAFQDREKLVVTLDALAGAPPSGTHILETAAELGIRNQLTQTFDDWRRWSAAVLESHLAYPTLLYFRSSHDNEAWLNSFGAVMDAATLVISTIEEESQGSARLMSTVGIHLVEDLVWFFRFEKSGNTYVEREEFDEAVARLNRAGYKCRPAAIAWEEFSARRARYAHPLNQMAKLLAIIPAQWIGDRSYVPHQRRSPRGRPRRT
jgi:hypothetical protein